MTESAYDFTIASLTEDDDGAKISCVLDDGDTVKSLKTYRLKLNGDAGAGGGASSLTFSPLSAAFLLIYNSINALTL